MVKLREIPRTAAFAWSPGTDPLYIATGTKSGAVDADFSSTTQLELWDLDLSNPTAGPELQPAASIDTDSRFNDIAWQSKPDSSHGIIAGGLENGSLELWDAGKIAKKESKASVDTMSKHSGAIKALQFNPFRAELLASAGVQGEGYISDLNNLSSPFRLGSTAGKSDDLECLDWNKKVPHILVTGSNGGFVTVWDMKTKKESLTLNNYGRKSVSAVVWDPDKPTRLATAVPIDSDPVILVWDLRNSNAPEKVLKGHEGGILSLSWCRDDNDLLLSSGKDNRTLCWNPQSGELYGEFSVVQNWTFQTAWNTRNPTFFATASFDGKIEVQTIQNTKKEQQAATNQNLDGEDFFSKAPMQTSTSSFSLPKAPKWFDRPCSVSFGFGGKIVTVRQEGDAKQRKSLVKISTFVPDSTLSGDAEAFAESMKNEDLATLCKDRSETALLDAEKEDWKVIESLISKNPRKDLVKHLGLSESEPKAEETEAKEESKEKDAAEDDDESFFDKPRGNVGDSPDEEPTSSEPFKLFDSGDSDVDKNITNALIMGNFSTALDICLKEDRLSDAFMIAICGGQSAIDKVQKAYFKKQSTGPKYLRLLHSVVGKNLWDVVKNADLSNWKEVMAAMCTFASAKEFPDLCEALGNRLSESSDTDESRKSASFCYLAGSKLERVVSIWSSELKESEQKLFKKGEGDSGFSIHFKALQSFIEKVTVFREVTKYQDPDQAATGDWKLEALYDKYIEYADILTSHGQLTIAAKYLELLPAKYPASDAARERIQRATGKAQAAQKGRPAAEASTFGGASSAFTNPQKGYQPQNPYAPQRPSINESPANPAPANPYAPQGLNQPYGQSPSRFQPSGPGYGQAPPSRQAVPPPSFGAPPQQGPPRNATSSPATAAAFRAQAAANWNDTPEDFFKPPTSRKSTPGIQPAGISAPFPNQPDRTSTPPTGPPTGPPRGSQGSGPPPRGPPRAGTSSRAADAGPPPSAATNMYAPPPPQQQPPPMGQSPVSPPIPRGASPYNPPPRGASPYNAPPSGAPAAASRYAPAPASANALADAQQRPPPPQQGAFAPARNSPPPPRGGPPPGNAQGGPPGGPPRGTPPAAKSTPAPAGHPPGDRSHIPEHAMPIHDLLSADMQRVKSKAPASFAPQVADTEKRLNILFDHLNNGTLIKPNTLDDLVELAQAIRAKDYDKATTIHLDILKHRTEECGNWMTGVKRLIGMSKATP